MFNYYQCWKHLCCLIFLEPFFPDFFIYIYLFYKSTFILWELMITFRICPYFMQQRKCPYWYLPIQPFISCIVCVYIYWYSALLQFVSVSFLSLSHTHFFIIVWTECFELRGCLCSNHLDSQRSKCLQLLKQKCH